MDALDGETPGSVLIRLGLGTDADSTKHPISEWQADMDRSSKVGHACVLPPPPPLLSLSLTPSGAGINSKWCQPQCAC